MIKSRFGSYLSGCWRIDTSSSVARALATMEMPGLDTVHCWSRVRSRVDCRQKKYNYAQLIIICCMHYMLHAYVAACIICCMRMLLMCSYVSWSNHVTAEIAAQPVSRDMSTDSTQCSGGGPLCSRRRSGMGT